jgi:hypothetical protein
MDSRKLKNLTDAQIRLYIDGVYDGIGIVKEKLKSIGMEYTCPSKAYILKYVFGKTKQKSSGKE